MSRLTLCACLPLLVVLAPHACAQELFGPRTDYPAGYRTTSVLSSDLDLDGYNDLAASGNGHLSVLANDGDAGFESRVEYSIGWVAPRSLSGSDLDADGDTDLAVADVDEGVVAVFLNNGDGTLQERRIYSVGDDPNSMFIADLDGDGDNDLAVSYRGRQADNSTLSVLLNGGDGTLSHGADYRSGYATSSVFCADLDVDGDIDLTAAIPMGEVRVLLNNGDGSFAHTATYEDDDFSPAFIYGSDWDGDGFTDLALANRHRNTVSVLLSNGDGTLAYAKSYFVGDNPVALFSADFDRDGDDDLVTANASGDDVTVRLNPGDGTFVDRRDIAVRDHPVAVFAADLDGDGDSDLAVANQAVHTESGYGTVSVLPNQSVGSMAPPPVLTSISLASGVETGGAYLTASGGNFQGGAVLRFGGVPADDIYVQSLNVITARTPEHPAGVVEVVVTNPDGQEAVLEQRFTFVQALFGFRTRYPAGRTPESVFGADLDGDGDNDLAVADAKDDVVGVFLNDGSGVFDARVSYASADGPLALFGADLDSDGDSDVAVASDRSDNVSVLLNNGDGTFAPRLEYGAGARPRALSVADLDGDADRDVAVANLSGAVSVLWNNGAGVFAQKSQYQVEFGPQSIASADLDGDGDNDLVTANNTNMTSAGGFNSDNVSVLMNRGDGTFAARVNFLAGPRPTSVFASDLDGDGDNDLAVGNSGNTVSVLSNNGSGDFAVEATYLTGNNLAAVFSADFDGDGDGDLAVGCTGALIGSIRTSTVSVLLNNGDATFQPMVDYPSGSGTVSVFSADFDGDGDNDLAAANYGSDDMTVWRNLSDVPSAVTETGRPAPYVPARHFLLENYPNPFNPQTSIRYILASSGIATLQVYSLSGQKLVDLASGDQDAGIHQVVWDGTDSTGRRLSSGVYICRLQGDGFEESRKMTLLR